MCLRHRGFLTQDYDINFTATVNAYSGGQSNPNRNQLGITYPEVLFSRRNESSLRLFHISQKILRVSEPRSKV
jgi:hypothetical protein